ncbi:MAG TPA: S8 family peptidase [Elusimicrobiales bacterium]|nr:S8 family peptidase [Elusimicrobiales bacterium]
MLPARFLLLLLLALSAVPAAALKMESYFSPAAGGGRSLEVASGAAVVKYKAGVSSAAAAAALSAAGFTVRNYFAGLDWAAVELPRGLSVAGGLALLKNIPVVAEAAPDRVFRPTRTSSDPFLGTQYALSRIQAFGAWEYGTGSDDVVIAVIDTGIDGSHPELSGKLAGTSKAFDPGNVAPPAADQPPTPACNHATRAAGAAAASSNNSVGIAGVSWGAKLLSLKVFAYADCNPACSQSSCGTTETTIAAAIDEARSQQPALGKVVINMSLGAGGACSGVLQTAVSNAVANGKVLLFAASGNAGSGSVDSPANCTGVVAVGATDNADSLASFSNAGTVMLTRGLTAPGVEVYTTDVGGAYASATGTSFAAPLAAGLAALLWSAKPAASPADIENFIFDSADDLGDAGPDREFGRGRINALKAMSLAVGDNSAMKFKGNNKAIAYPNPFRPKTQRLVSFTVPQALVGGNTEVKIYTAEGEQVRKLDGLAWDGKNELGAVMASGIYLFKVKTDKDIAAGKFALIR